MVLEKIRQTYPQLTKSQRKLADFLANSYHEAAFMTASRMAKRLSLNEATVIRFAQRLGYAGYPELIHDVQAVVQEELEAPVESEIEAVEERFLTHLGRELENLSRAVSHVTPEVAHGLLALLQGARRIHVAGQGVSYHLAGVLVAGLASLGLDARLAAGDPHSLALTVAGLESSDAFVGVVAVDESPEIARAIRMAQERGARTLAVAWSPISESAQAAGLALICPPDERLAVPSVATIAAYLDALVQTAAGLEQGDGQGFSLRAAGIAQQLRSG